MPTPAAQLPPHLHSLLKNLYFTFRNYPPSEGWQDYALGTPPAHFPKLLLTQKLPELPLEVFDYFSWKGLVQIQPAEILACLKWCLPRIFDSAICRSLNVPAENTHVAIEYLATCLVEHNWQSWRENEVDAISQLFDPWLQLLLAENNPAESPDRILALAALLGLPIQPTLHHWSTTPLLPSTLHLARFINDNHPSLSSHRDLSSWQNLWGSISVPESARKQAAAWLLHPTTLARLEAAFFSAPARDQPALSLAAEILRFVPPNHQ